MPRRQPAVCTRRQDVHPRLPVHVLTTDRAGATPDLAATFEAHHVVLVRYLYRMCGDADLAADAAQEAFVRAIDRPPRDGVSRAWLFTVATNALLQDRRNAANRMRLLSVFRDEPVQHEPEPFAAMVAADRTRAVRRALDALPPRERAALLMRAEGLAYREIAAALNTTTGSVGTLLSRGLARMDECLRPMVESL